MARVLGSFVIACALAAGALFVDFELLRRQPRVPCASVPPVPHNLSRPRYSHCRGMYIDLGSNVGVQIRKLYQPRLYPGAPVLELFERHFGRNRSDVCAVGFEPNPRHTARLREVEAHYRGRCGFTVDIFAETAASTRSGAIDLELVETQMERDNNYWGATVVPDLHTPHRDAATSTSRIAVRAESISDFILREVPAHAAVVVKMDIEGAEMDVLADLAISGALCRVDLLFAEFHANRLPAGSADADYMSRLQRTVPDMLARARCATGRSPRISDLDDETFGDDHRAAPVGGCD